MHQLLRVSLKWAIATAYLALCGLILYLVPRVLLPVLLAAYLWYLVRSFLTLERDVARLHDLRPMTRWDVPHYAAFRDQLLDACTTVGLRREPVWAVMHSDYPQAMAVGGYRGVVVLTTGLLQLHPPHELVAVVSHEAAHLKSRDHWPALLGATWLGLLAEIAAWLDRTGRSAGGLAGAVFLLPGLALDLAVLVVGWVAGMFLAKRSRIDEHLADLAGASATSATVMIAALERMRAFAEAEHLRPRLARWSMAWVIHQLNASHPDPAARIQVLQAAAERGEVVA